MMTVHSITNSEDRILRILKAFEETGNGWFSISALIQRDGKWEEKEIRLNIDELRAITACFSKDYT